MLDFVRDNWFEMFGALGMFLTFATAVAKLTPNTRDDRWVAKAVKIFQFFAVNLKR